MNQENNFSDVTVEELKEKMDQGDSFVLVDVRENDEFEHSHIKGAVHIPLGLLSSEYDDLDDNQVYIMQCRSGVRSAKAAQFLVDNGFENVSNLVGGIIDWSEKIDPDMTVM